MPPSSRIRKSQPDQASVYVVPEITDMAEEVMQDAADFVAPRMAPVVRVKQKAGKFHRFPRGYFMRDGMKPRTDGGRSAGGGFKVTHGDFNCDVFAWHTKQGPQVRANAKSVDLDRAGANICATKAMISMEKDWVTKFFGAGKWSTELTGVASGVGAGEFLSWADANAEPIRDLKTALRTQKKLTSKRPNKAVFSEDVWDALTEHPNVVARVSNGQTSGFAEITTQQIASLLRLDEVLIAGAIEATNAEKNDDGASDEFDFIVPSGVLLAYVTATPSVVEPTAMATFVWEDYLDGAAGEFGQVMYRWYEQGDRSWYYEVEQARDQNLVSADYGTYLATPLQT